MEPTQKPDPYARKRHIVARIRAMANITLALGAIVVLIAWAMRWQPETIAPFGLLTMAAFIVSVTAILIENRIPEPPEAHGQTTEGSG